VSFQNLRHLRVFLDVAELGSLTLASERCNVSQPAVTQAIGKLEREAGGPPFDRTRQGFFLSERGRVLAQRVRRAFGLVDEAFDAVSPRLRLTATVAQLRALIAMREAESFTLAARRLGVAQPTVHRAVTQLEQEAGRALFERTSFGLVATRPCKALTQAARLALAELDQAVAEMAEFDGREGGRIVIGSLPLSRMAILPEALVSFRRLRPTMPITVIDGVYDDLLAGVRRGEIDFMVGALREPAPVSDVVEEPLFADRLAVICGLDHPLRDRRGLGVTDLRNYAWTVPREGTRARAQFDQIIGPEAQSESIIECGSILMMREMLNRSDMLGCISELQASTEISFGLIKKLDVDIEFPARMIGLTRRSNWEPTTAQTLLLDLIRSTAGSITSV